jgi:hypothetical protein
VFTKKIEFYLVCNQQKLMKNQRMRRPRRLLSNQSEAKQARQHNNIQAKWKTRQSCFHLPPCGSNSSLNRAHTGACFSSKTLLWGDALNELLSGIT